MENQECLNRFESFLRDEKKVSQNTLSSYMRDIRQLADYLSAERRCDIVSAGEDDLQSYTAYLKDSGKSAATISRSTASIKNLYSYLGIHQIIRQSPASKLSCERGKQKPPQILTTQEMDRLLEQPQCIDAKGYRDKAMLELLYATGMRVTELIDLNVEDVNLSGGTVHCRSRNKDRVVPVYPAAVKALDDYIRLVRPQMLAESNDPTLFVNIGGERMSRQGLWKLIKHYQRKANIDKDITPHMLRHSFAAHLLENGANIHDIQEMLGHADASSTNIYTRFASHRLEESYRKTHPRA